MATVVQEIDFCNFDSNGEPFLQVMSDGSLVLVFEFMPPSDVPEDGYEIFDDFDAQISKAIGLPVTWDDREVMIIEQPQEDTIDRLKQFIEHYR